MIDPLQIAIVAAKTSNPLSKMPIRPGPAPDPPPLEVPPAQPGTSPDTMPVPLARTTTAETPPETLPTEPTPIEEPPTPPEGVLVQLPDILKSLQAQIGELVSITTIHTDKIARTQDAVKLLLCPKGYEVEDMTLKEGVRPAIVLDCLNGGICNCGVHHALNAATWVPQS